MASSGGVTINQEPCLSGQGRPTIAAPEANQPQAVGEWEGPVQDLGPGLPNPQATFVHKCNIQRSGRDFFVSMAMMSAFTVRALQLHATLPLPSLVLYAAALALTVAILPWSRCYPDKYARWREWPMAVLRLLLTSPPFAHLWAARGIASLPVGSPLASLAFLLRLLFSSNSLFMAILGLGLPVRFGAHVTVQLAMQQLASLGNESTCQALLAPAESARAGGMFAVAAAAAGRSSQEFVGWWYFALSFLSVFLPPPWLPSSPRSQPMQQCVCLLEFLQLGLGLLLPIAVMLLSEASAYCAHCQRSRGTLSRGGEAQGRGHDGCFMQRLYLHACELIGGTLGVVKLWVAVSVLALLWESAQVRM